MHDRFGGHDEMIISMNELEEVIKQGRIILFEIDDDLPRSKRIIQGKK